MRANWATRFTRAELLTAADVLESMLAADYSRAGNAAVQAATGVVMAYQDALKLGLNPAASDDAWADKADEFQSRLRKMATVITEFEALGALSQAIVEIRKAAAAKGDAA